MKCDKLVYDLCLDDDFRKSISDSVNKASGLPYSLSVGISYDPLNFCYIIYLYDPTIDFTFRQFIYVEDCSFPIKTIFDRLAILNDIIRGFVQMINMMNFYDAEV